MSSRLYLFLQVNEASESELPQQLSNVVSWVIDKPDSELSLFKGSLTDAASEAKLHSVTAVLPGQMCSFLKANVPGKNRQRIQQAVPYVLEDSVIDDVDDLHFAISEKTSQNEDASDDEYHVVVINKSYVESIIKELAQADIHADVITTDYLLLAEDNTLFIEEQKALFNGADAKFSTDLDCLSHSVDCLLPKDKQIILIVVGNNIADELTFLTDKYDVKQEGCNDPAEVCLVKNASTDNIINLLQGPYKKKKNWSKTGKTWLPIAALFLVWLSVQGALFLLIT